MKNFIAPRAVICALLLSGLGVSLWAAATSALPIVKRWERSAESGMAIRIACTIDQVCIFTGAGTLETRQLEDGAVTGSSIAGFVPASQPQVGSGMLLSAGKDGALYALDANTGALVWKQSVSAGGVSDFSVNNGTVYIAGGPDKTGLSGFNINDGKAVLNLPMNYRILSAPAVLGKTLYFGTAGGTLYAADMTTGIVLDSLSSQGEFYHQKPVPFRDELLLSPTGYEKRIMSLSPAKGLAAAPLFEVSFAHASYPDADELRKISFERPQVRDVLMKQYMAKSFGGGSAPSVENTFLPLGPVHTSSWVVRGDYAAITVKEPDCLARAQYHVIIVDMASHKVLLDYKRFLEDTPFLFCADPVFEEGRVIALLGQNTLVSLSVPACEVEWEMALSGSVVPPLLASGKSLVALTDDGRVTAFSLRSVEDQPLTYAMQQNSPNPFNPTTAIRYQLPKESKVTLKIYNMAGQEITTLVNAKSGPGTFRVLWNGLNSNRQTMPSGTYFAVIKAGTFKKVISMTLLK